jgi:flagellar assembly factor FliW
MVTTSLGDCAPTDSPDDGHLADSDSCITFPLGLVGWESWKRFVLLMDDEGDELPVAIMQLVDDPDVSIMVTDPSLVYAGYEESVTLSEDDRAFLGLADGARPVLYCSLAVGADGWLTANLLGPLAINPANRLGVQVVLVNSSYSTRHPIMRLAQPTDE